MKRLFLGLALALCLAPAAAQVLPQPGPPTPQACAFNTTPVTLTDGQAGWVQCDSAGAQKTSSAASAIGGYSFLNIAAGQATTVVKASAGVLHSIILNSAATATNTTIVYDNASGAGTVIGRPAVTTATIPVTLLYNLQFANGLTIITGTANGGDMTVVYK